MREKEKRDRGLLYNLAKDKKLQNELRSCKDVCYAFNLTLPSDKKERDRIIRKLFGKTKKNFNIEPNFWCDYGYNIEIGENFYANHNLVILDVAKVKFGDNVFIAPNCAFYTAGHPVDVARRSVGLEFGYPITVGNNVWIGGNVVVLPNVIIGDNSVIGAGSVVTKSIPSGVVAVGNPCKVLRAVTEQDRLDYNRKPNPVSAGFVNNYENSMSREILESTLVECEEFIPLNLESEIGEAKMVQRAMPVESLLEDQSADKQDDFDNADDEIYKETENIEETDNEDINTEKTDNERTDNYEIVNE